MRRQQPVLATGRRVEHEIFGLYRAAAVRFSDEELQEYQQWSPGSLDEAVQLLAESEAAVRHLRKRLEASRDGSPHRICAAPGCDAQVVGRADATYCSPRCRLRAHRASHRDTTPVALASD